MSVITDCVVMVLASMNADGMLTGETDSPDVDRSEVGGSIVNGTVTDGSFGNLVLNLLKAKWSLLVLVPQQNGLCSSATIVTPFCVGWVARASGIFLEFEVPNPF